MLHVFSAVVNLINEEAEVLSICVPALGRGPFALVLDRPEDLQQRVTAGSVVVIQEDGMYVGELDIEVQGVELWDPIPAWKRAAARREELNARIGAILAEEAPEESMALLLHSSADETRLEARFRDKASAGVESLTSGLIESDDAQLLDGARTLAGLGIGLTPAGDDFLVGVMHGLWLCLLEDRATYLSSLMCVAAAERTNVLSAAWLRAAAAGEAGEVWHDLLAADGSRIDDVVRRILPTGHTSGADALAGFRHVLSLEAMA